MKLKALLVLCASALLFSSCDRDEPFIAPPPAPVIKAIVVNEIYTSGTVAEPDWIELYNPNTTAITVGGYKIYNDDGKTGKKAKKAIAAGTSIPAKSYLVINVNTAGDTLTSFDMPAAGGSLYMENDKGTVLETIAYPALTFAESYARIPDGEAAWQKTGKISKNAANTTGNAPVLVPVVMNEIYSMGVATDPDWIEFYNPNTIAVPIGGYKVYDSGGQTNTKPKKEIPAGTSIPAKGYYVLVVDNGGTGDLSGFGLSSGGEDVWFEDNTGKVIDNIKFGVHTTTTSYARIPDGSTNWQVSSAITREAANK